MNGIVRKVHGLLLCLALLSIGNNVFASQYSEVIIADNPIAYWKLDQTTGSVAVDSIAANDATLIGNPTRNNPSGVPYDDGASLLLNGLDQYIELPNTGLLDLQSFTFEAWLKRTTVQGSCPALYVNLPAGAFTDSRGVIIRLPGDVNCQSTPEMEWGEGFGEPESVWWYNNINDTDWHHAVVTFDYDAANPPGTLIFYIDGLASAELPTQSFWSGISYENAAMGPPDDGVFIGVEPDASNNLVNYLDGYLDEIAFYGYVLTPEQVEEHFYAGTQPPPRVVAIESLVFNSGLADTLLVSFNSDIRIDSFTVDDFTMSGPDGAVVATSVVSNDGSDSQVLVSFPPQITPGVYDLEIGPDILGKNGLAMDQDQDGIFGEPQDDRYTSSLTLGNPDPTRVLSVTPTGLGNTPVASLSVQFELDVDPNSFTVDDIVLTGPDGAITPSTITTTNNLNFTVSFTAPLASDGLY
ncbi:MAG: LamG domain-containing protein, partial [Candidatus Thiodiazotropha endolucinida]